MKTLHLLDASSFIYRSYFALPPLETRDGFPTGAIYGFLRAILSIWKSENPEYFVVVFDAPAQTKREKMYAEYKAGRPSMPDPLKVQIPVIKELLNLMGIPVLEVPGYEADDIIAMLAKKFSRGDFFVKIYTPDKDMLQLVSDRVRVINPISWEVFDPKKVEEKFGVPPQKLADYLALVGDKIDNVEGVKGVGPKTAVKLIEKFGGVEGILKNWEEFHRQYPTAKKEDLELSYRLVKPMLDADVDVNEEDLRIKEPKTGELRKKLEKLEMKSILKDVEKLFRIRSQRSLF